MVLRATLLVAVGAATVRAAADPPANVVAAFAADGFTIAKSVQYGSGWGIAAESVNATIGQTGMKKPAYYVSGTAYEMGWLRCAIAENATAQLATTYLQHIVPALLSPEADEWLQVGG